MCIRDRSTAWIKGKQYAISLNKPPIKSKLNHVPLSHAVRLVNKAPQIPPTCLSLKIVPQNKPIAIKIIEMGIVHKMAIMTSGVIFKPRQNAAR